MIAYSLKTGPVPVKEWMRYSGEFTYLQLNDGKEIAKMTLPDLYWQHKTIERYKKLGMDASSLPGFDTY